MLHQWNRRALTSDIGRTEVKIQRLCGGEGLVNSVKEGNLYLLTMGAPYRKF